MIQKTILKALAGSLALMLLLGAGCSDDTTSSQVFLMGLSTDHLEFITHAGGNPNPALQKVRFSMEGKSSADWTASHSSDWLRIGPGSTDTIYISVFSANLSSGLYVDTVVVESPRATNSPLYVVTTLTVRNRVIFSPPTLTFGASAGGADPKSQILEVLDFDGPLVRYEATTTAPWINLANANGVVPGSVTVSVDISGMAGGQYRDSIVITSPDLPLAREALPCYLNLSTWAPLDLGFGSQIVKLEGLEFIDANNGWISGWRPSGADDPHGLVYQTTDGGTTWTKTLDRFHSKFAGLAAINAERCWVVGEPAHIEYTTDAGDSWTKVANLPVDTAAEFIEVSFVNVASGWIVGAAGLIIHTSDSGKTWVIQSTPIVHSLNSVIFIDEQNGWAAGNHGNIIHTSDGGANWIAQSSGTISDLRSVAFIDSQIGWIVGRDGVVLKTTNGGSSWIELESPIDTWLLDVTFVSATLGWAVGFDGLILHTSDGGQTWVEQPVESTVSLTEIFFLSHTQGWVVGDGGTVFKTTNGGF